MEVEDYTLATARRTRSVLLKRMVKLQAQYRELEISLKDIEKEIKEREKRHNGL